MRHYLYILSALTITFALIACANKYKPIIPCEKPDFQSNYSAANLYNWGDENYIKAKKGQGDEDRINTYCIKAIQQRGGAYCKSPYDPVYKEALLESIALCRTEARAMGIDPDELLIKAKYAEAEAASPSDAKSDSTTDGASDAPAAIDTKDDEIVTSEN